MAVAGSRVSTMENPCSGIPRRLSLRLFCTTETPAKDALNVWPALPLIVEGDLASSAAGNIIVILGQGNRKCQVILWHLASWQLEQVLATMHVPFPELTQLWLTSNGDRETLPVIPDSFLGGSAPRLRYFELNGIPFPGLPKLLLSATSHLVYLHLFDIPHSGYISPDAITALLSVLSSLERFYLEFQSPQSFPDRETLLPPLSNHSVISALRYFRFKGAIEYLEDLVTHIDTPQLDEM